MPATFGLIGGSGLLKSKLAALQGLAEEVVDTPHGRVFLRTGPLGTAGDRLVFVQRHDAKPSRAYTQPADINYAAVALALKAKGADFVVGICSVGSLKASIGVGALLVADDYWCPFDLRRVYTDARAHLAPSFDEPLRAAILETVRRAGFHPQPHGVYVNAMGPRFETKAEIRTMAAAGDVVGMTGAHEAGACAEVGLPYAMLCMVDNYANGIGGPPLTLQAFHEAQAANLVVVEQCTAALLEGLAARVAPSATKAAGGAGGSSSSHSGSASDAPTPVDLVVHGRYLVPMAPGREQEVKEGHAIVVKDGVILDILPSAAAGSKYAPVRTVRLDAEHVLIPGLVNAHTHLALNLLKGVADDLPLAQWLTEQIWPTEARLVDPAFVRAGSRAAIAELLRSGVTTVNDMYWFPQETAEVLESTGVRGCVSMIVLEFPSKYAGAADEYISKGLAIREGWAAKGGSSRVTFSFGPHAPYTVGDASLARIQALSEQLDVPVHVHLHETAGEVAASRTGGKEGTTKHLSEQLSSPIENFDRIGLLNRRLVAVHMTCLSEDEISRVAAAGASVVHCPASNLKLASGFCPVGKLMAAGVNVALGTDSASSNNSLDFFSELKLAAVLAKGVAADATAVPAWQALRMATYNGAKALGLEKVTGSLEVGKAADFVAVSLAGIDAQPLYNVLSHLVYATSRSQVTDVWVAGAQLLNNRELTTIDEAAVLAEVKEWAAKVRPTSSSSSAGASGEGKGAGGAAAVAAGSDPSSS